MSEEAGIVQFPGQAPADDAPLRIAPPRADGCDHRQTALDAKTRVVTCANPSCGAVLDPFNVLLVLAEADGDLKRRWDRFREMREEMVVHAPGGERHTLCGSDSDKKEYRVTISNLIRDVTCRRCRAALDRKGKRSPFWDARLTSAGEVVRGSDRRREKPGALPYHPQCGGYHRQGECPARREAEPSGAPAQ